MVQIWHNKAFLSDACVVEVKDYRCASFQYEPVDLDYAAIGESDRSRTRSIVQTSNPLDVSAQDEPWQLTVVFLFECFYRVSCVSGRGGFITSGWLFMWRGTNQRCQVVDCWPSYMTCFDQICAQSTSHGASAVWHLQKETLAQQHTAETTWDLNI